MPRSFVVALVPECTPPRYMFATGTGLSCVFPSRVTHVVFFVQGDGLALAMRILSSLPACGVPRLGVLFGYEKGCHRPWETRLQQR